jgi:hypothetical protein
MNIEREEADPCGYKTMSKAHEAPVPACGVVQRRKKKEKMVLVDRRKKRLAFASNSTLSITKLRTWMVLTKLLFALRERWISCLWKEAFASSASSAAACE